jgi:DNA-binding MltR family transcriptional regulator
MRDADLKDFTAFLHEFQSETDRGAALVGAALIDQKLADTLRAFFVPGKTAGELLDGGTAPLGTFSARIKAAHALGLIDAFELRECNLIRKIRNEFAHSVHGLAFADPTITVLCDKLQSDLPSGREAFVGKPRGVFINAVVLTVMRLTYRAEWVAKEQRVTKSWP